MQQGLEPFPVFMRVWRVRVPTPALFDIRSELKKFNSFLLNLGQKKNNRKCNISIVQIKYLLLILMKSFASLAVKSEQVRMKSKPFGFGEIKSVLLSAVRRIHHEVISSAKQIYPVLKDGFSWKERQLWYKVIALFWQRRAKRYILGVILR